MCVWFQRAQRVGSPEVLLFWVLTSLAAVALVGEHPYLALALAGAGGVYMGWLATPQPRSRCAVEADGTGGSGTADGPG